MMIKSNLFSIFSAFTLASASFVITTKNPIFSVLFLILTFFNIAATLLLLNFDFLPIVILVVYVGAIAVLFLFVLMMLNIKLAELIDNHYNIMWIGFIFGFVLIVQLMFLLNFNFDNIEKIDHNSIAFLFEYSTTYLTKMDYFNLNLNMNNIKQVGFVFFSSYLEHFLFAGLVLLLAMIAAILLTVNKQFLSKNQDIYNQILKNFNASLVKIK